MSSAGIKKRRYRIVCMGSIIQEISPLRERNVSALPPPENNRVFTLPTPI
jgi:hypothetical protein